VTPQNALADGHLADALALQLRIVAEGPADPAARLFLFELQLLAQRFRDARATLHAIVSHDSNWPAARHWYRRLLRAARTRHRGRPPAILRPAPAHARLRRRLIAADPADSLELLDRADARSPHLVGHVDGREFDGLRDADDRYASVLEAFVGSTSVWIPFERIRQLELPDPTRVFESAYRPARILLDDGRTLAVVLPLVYSRPRTDWQRLALDTDFARVRHGPQCCVGAKLLLAGEEEIPLGTLRQLDVRPWT
jgi:type VI secretion system protein ImpE